LFVIALLITSSSCSVQKRVHRKGWFIQWHGIKSAKEKSVSEEESKTNGFVVSTEKVTKPNATSVSDQQSTTKDSENIQEVATPSSKSNSEFTPAIEQNVTFDSTTASNETVENDRKDEKLPQKIVLLTMAVNSLSMFFVILNLGFIPILIPIGLSIIIALFTYASITDDLNKNGSISPKRKLWTMLAFIVSAWGLFCLIIFTNLNPVVSTAIIGYSLFILLVLFSRKKLARKNSQPLQSTNDIPQPTDDTDISMNDEEELQNSTQEKSVTPLRISRAFPKLSGAIGLFLILGTLLLIFMLVIGSILASFGTVLPLAVVALLLIPLAFIIAGFGLAVHRGNLYKAYLDDFEKDTANSTSSFKKNEPENRISGAVFSLIFLLFALLLLAVLLLALILLL